MKLNRVVFVYSFSYFLFKTSPIFCFCIPMGKYNCHHTILAWILKKWVMLSSYEFAENRNRWYLFYKTCNSHSILSQFNLQLNWTFPSDTPKHNRERKLYLSGRIEFLEGLSSTNRDSLWALPMTLYHRLCPPLAIRN